MARGVCRGVQAFLAESCCCCRGVSASVGLAWLAFDERRAVASRRVVRSSLPCFTVAVHRFAEPVKTEAVERTALLRLPCVSANQPALLNPDPGPRVDTLNHQLLHGLYTCCYTPIPRADQLQLATSHIRFAGRKRAAVWTRSLPSPRRVPDPLHSSALRRERQTQGTYNTPPHIRRSNAQSLHPIPGRDDGRRRPWARDGGAQRGNCLCASARRTSRRFCDELSSAGRIHASSAQTPRPSADQTYTAA
jgi:hypothetical protein